MAKYILNASLVGSIVERDIGVRRLTAEFNRYRSRIGLGPVLKQTVHRYNGGGVGYDKTPTHYRKFLAQYVALK